MNNALLKKLQTNMYSSTECTLEHPSTPRVFVGGETLYGGEIDYFWIRIFARVNAGAIKPKEQRKKQHRVKKTKTNLFPASVSTLRATELVRKINFCLLQTKDPKYIKRIEAPANGLYHVKMKRCEKYVETKYLTRYWKRYLEDVQLNYTALIPLGTDADYALDFYSLRLFDVNE